MVVETTTSLIDTKQTTALIPKLRFKEFEGEWNINKFSKFIKLYRGSSPRPIIKYVTTDEEGVNWIKIGDTKNSYNYRINAASEKITKLGALKSRYVKRGEVILANSMSFGKSYLLEIDGCIYDGWFVLREYENSFDKEFLLQVLNSDYLQKQYLRLSTGGVVQNISSDIVYSTRLFCPHPPEQQKIASFLSAVDEKIQQLTKKKALLEQYKKGVMQKLFSGQLRFKDENGNPYPDWEEKRLGEVATFLKGKGISKADLSDEGGLECIRYGELYTVYGETIIEVFSRTNVPKKELVLSEKDDVIIPASGETQIDIATASCVLKANIALGGDLNIIRSANDGVFLAYYLNSALKFDIARLSQGVSVVHLYSSQLKTLKIGVPQIEEQQTIATYLSRIDTKIEAVTHQITQTQTFKKGLLQQLFV